MPRKKPLGICETTGCQKIAQNVIFKLSLSDQRRVEVCDVCVRIIEQENKDVQESIASSVTPTWVEDGKILGGYIGSS